MSKKKGFKKSQVALAVMVVALGAAVWLNMRYAGALPGAGGNSSKFLGEAEYVGGIDSGSAIETAAKPDNTAEQEEGYFTRLRKERQQARDEAIEQIEDTLADTNLSTDEKKTLTDTAAAVALRAERESSIETVLKAKGFSSVLAVIGDKDINIIVKSEGLIPAEIAQIQDVVTAHTDFSLAEIKIISMTEEEIKNAAK